MSSVATVLRLAYPRALATLSRISGAPDQAEDLLQDAATKALVHWARSGGPDNPSAWLVLAPIFFLDPSSTTSPIMARNFAMRCASWRFHPCPPLDPTDVDEVLATVTAYVGRLLAHAGSGDGDDGGMLDEWADGTTHLLFDPVELLGRLAALTPRPRINLILYYGVLAPRAAWRSLVVQFGAAASPGAAAERDAAAHGHLEAADCRHTRNYLWAELMRRSLGLDVLAYPRCGGRLTLIALISDPAVIVRLLGHLGLPTDIPEAQPALINC